MKHIKILVVVALLLGFSNQLTAQNNIVDNKGQWTVFENNKYHPTIDDVVQIAKGMPYMKSGNLYRLENGQRFWVFCPEKWTPLMRQILSKVKGSPVTDVASELAKGKVLPWDDNISTKTQNYAITNCEVSIVDGNYSGGDGIEGVNYMGYMVLKTYRSCCNPNDPKISTPPPAADIPIVPDVPGVKKDSTVQKGGNTYNYYTVSATATVTNSGNSNGGTSEIPTTSTYVIRNRQVPMTYGYREQVVYPHQNVYQLAASFNFGGNQQQQRRPRQQTTRPPRVPNDGNGNPINPNGRRIPNDGNGRRYP